MTAVTEQPITPETEQEPADDGRGMGIYEETVAAIGPQPIVGEMTSYSEYTDELDLDILKDAKVGWPTFPGYPEAPTVEQIEADIDSGTVPLIEFPETDEDDEDEGVALLSQALHDAAQDAVAEGRASEGPDEDDGVTHDDLAEHPLEDHSTWEIVPVKDDEQEAEPA